jgi:hypothetical protein
MSGMGCEPVTSKSTGHERYCFSVMKTLKRKPRALLGVSASSHKLSGVCGAPSLTRGRVCLWYMLLVLASVVFIGSDSLGTRDHILLSQIWDFPLRRLLRSVRLLTCSAYNISARTAKRTPFLCCSPVSSVETRLFAEPLLSNGCCIVAYFAVVA